MPNVQMRRSAMAARERGADVRGGKMSRFRTAGGKVDGSAQEWGGVVHLVAH